MNVLGPLVYALYCLYQFPSYYIHRCFFPPWIFRSRCYLFFLTPDTLANVWIYTTKQRINNEKTVVSTATESQDFEFWQHCGSLNLEREISPKPREVVFLIRWISFRRIYTGSVTLRPRGVNVISKSDSSLNIMEWRHSRGMRAVSYYSSITSSG